VPTYERLARFDRDYATLTDTERAAFKAAVKKFVDDLERGQGFRQGLRVKGVKGAKGVFEMTWADDGGATFSYRGSIREGEPHVVWHRVGGHEVIG
jgi:hypothetical protein